MDEQYFTDSSPASAEEIRTIEVSARGFDLSMRVSSRVFSGSKLDLGTRQLLEIAPDLPEDGTFLDLGCGWGPIALALADAAPGATVLAADVNERAVDLAARNAAAAGHTNIHAAEATALAAELKGSGAYVDLIWSNPPVRIGKAALHDMLLTWLGLLSDDGEAWLVVSRNLGADSLMKWLAAQGHDVERAASSKGFRVLRVKR